jgi:hypothetical protein
MWRTVLVLLAIGAGACTPYDPSLSAEPFYCGPTEPRCPDGYTCFDTGAGSAVCAATTPGSGSGSGSGTCTMTFTGVLATWDFSGQPGSQVSTTAASSAPGVTAGSISRAPALTAAAGTGSINATNWSTAQLDTTKYYTLAITPPAGCAMSFTSLSIDALSSGTGPTTAGVATSTDSFAHTTAVSATAPSTPSLAVTGAAAIELRIYGFMASAAGGTMRIQNTLSVTGMLH